MQPQQPYAQPPMPQYPQQPAPQGYPQQPAPPAYPAPQPAYPPQHYPQQPAPQQGYPQPGYPQGYAQPQYAPPAPPAPPLPPVSLDDYWQQPSSSGGPSLKFKDAAGNPQIGKAYEGYIARRITDSDVRPQTDKYGVAQTYRDGRPKSVMVVPLLMQPTTEFPDGQAGWWVKGQSRDELARAMAEAGAPAGAPEAGAFVRITLVNVRPIPNMSPAFQYRVDYTRPQGAAQAPAQQPAQAPPPVQQAVPQAAPVPQPMPQPAPQQYQNAPAQPMAPAMQQQPVPPVPAPQPVPQQAPQPAAAPGQNGFSPEQQALFAKLTGGQS